MQKSSNIRPESESHPAAKFVTVVWGSAYIERFASLALPSFLAPGNLPALAAETNLEIVILTSRNDIANFRKHDTFKRLQTVCPVSFIEIDDLITNGLYGVTLTLAYARAMFRYGRAMTSTHFVLMNADFILADGSLRSLARHIHAGRSIVLGPSFRSTAEAVEPELERAVDPASGTLVMKPREMVELALAHPHPTTIAKTVTQGLCHSDHPNQLFWQVDRHTVLARYYLIFPLCLRPEREVTTVNSYIDYCFLPEMCPSGDEVVMDDSDEFFMLELQNSSQERFMVRLGHQTIKDTARRLQSWTTAEHRRAARHEIVFHSEDFPSELQQVKRAAQKYVDSIEQQLGKPLRHAFHYHWIGGVQAWRDRRTAQGVLSSPAEIAPMPSRSALRLIASHARASSIHILRQIRCFIGRSARVLADNLRNISRVQKIRRIVDRRATVFMGNFLQNTPFHPEWLEYRVLVAATDSIPSNRATRLLVVGRDIEVLTRLPRRFRQPEFLTVADALQPSTSRAWGESTITHVLIQLQDWDCRFASQIFRHCQSRFYNVDGWDVFLHDRNGGLSALLVPHIEDIAGCGLGAAAASFSGGHVRWFLRKLWLVTARHYERFGAWSLPWVVPATLLLAPITLVANLVGMARQPSNKHRAKCSALHLRLGAASQ